jgi:hypothetical protein
LSDRGDFLKMNKVFIVRGGYYYEGSSPLKGFSTREAADSYAKTVPVIDIDDDENGAIWDYVFVEEILIEE